MITYQALQAFTMFMCWRACMVTRLGIHHYWMWSLLRTTQAGFLKPKSSSWKIRSFIFEYLEYSFMKIITLIIAECTRSNKVGSMDTSDFGCTQKRGIVLGKLLSSNNCIMKMKVCNIKGMLCLCTCSRFFLVATLLPGFFSFFSFDSRNLKRVYPQSGWWVVKRRRYM